jgi:translation initiation factor 2 subunit 3
MDINEIIHYQPIVNVGVLGHVAHGKSTLVRKITGIKTQKHTNEKKTGRTIKLGYANVKIFKCPKCHYYFTKASDVMTMKCEHCNDNDICDDNIEPEWCKLENHISFVDAPGHEFLMTTMLNGAAVMDCAILVVASNEQVPQPQTQEHLIAADIMGIDNILIVQNKIDTITLTKVRENTKDIKTWVQGTSAENSPIIPTSAYTGANVQRVIEALAQLKVNAKNIERNPVFACIRSFDVNKPGISVRDLEGGVIGGTLLQGNILIGDELEIKPGLKTDNGYYTLKTEIISIQSEKNQLQKAIPGGLIALQTYVDPRFTAKDILVGSIIGKDIPEPVTTIKIKYYLIKDDNVNSSRKFEKEEHIRITYLSRTTEATVKRIKKRILTLKLNEPLCIIRNCNKLSIARNIDGHNRLAGVGKIENVPELTDGDKFDSVFGEGLPQYEKLLEDVKNICVKKSTKKTTIKINPPECHKQGGARTIWTNFQLITEQLEKPIEHFKQFVSSEIGTNTSLTSQNELLLYGSYRPNNFENVVRSYLRKYCKCGGCGNFDVILEVSKNYDTITCKWCGNSKVMNCISNDYSKKGKGGKIKI